MRSNIRVNQNKADRCVCEWMFRIKLCKIKMCEKTRSREKTRSLGGWMGGWMDEWMDGCARKIGHPKKLGHLKKLGYWGDGWVSEWS